MQHTPAKKPSSLQPGDPWYVNSPLDHNDFWVWIRRVSDDEGHMPLLLQQDIMRLLGLSSTKVNEALTTGLEKFQAMVTPGDLEELLED